MLPNALGESLLGILLVSVALLLLFWMWRVVDGNPRRLVWALCALASAPALGFGIVYWFGIPIALAEFSFGTLVSSNRRLYHLPAAVYAIGFVYLAFYTASRHINTAERIGIILFIASIFLAMLTVTKLGRVFGTWLWSTDSPQRDAC